MVIGVAANTFSSSTRNSARIREKRSERKRQFFFFFKCNGTVTNKNGDVYVICAHLYYMYRVRFVDWWRDGRDWRKFETFLVAVSFGGMAHMLVIIQHIYKYVHEKNKMTKLTKKNKKGKKWSKLYYVVQECGWGLFKKKNKLKTK